MRLRRPLTAFLAVLVGMSLASSAVAKPLAYPAPVKEGLSHPAPPEVTAQAWILYDASTDAVLASVLPDERRSVASTTKIMTGLLALERGDFEELVTISQRAADTGEREIGLVTDEEVTLGALVKAALIHSGNDAATAIAEHIGGSVEGFVDLMNQRAAELGLRNTRFANPHGLDAPDHYSSARDMLNLAREAMQHQDFRDIVRSRIVVFPEAPDGTKRIGTATNLLLGDYEGASGIKTGFTLQALLTFVASAERQGRRLYAVVLGSEGTRAHLSDARRLFDYGFEDLGVYGVLGTGNRYVSRFDQPEPGPMVTAARIESLAHLGASGLLDDPPTARETAPEPIPPPVAEIRRTPDQNHSTLRGAARFWLDLFSGD
jgi:D-alanyl-D-alanine carboxypeptidase (penicillin-binding protein 5/6)